MNITTKSPIMLAAQACDLWANLTNLADTRPGDRIERAIERARKRMVRRERVADVVSVRHERTAHVASRLLQVRIWEKGLGLPSAGDFVSAGEGFAKIVSIEQRLVGAIGQRSSLIAIVRAYGLEYEVSSGVFPALVDVIADLSAQSTHH